ncbi:MULTISPECIES: DUF3313 family protein [Methylibium]|uniref:DUF3313 family protein n=1 Tax=Methylibium TaxID=316612 RepID=UPI00003CC986|nr:MULTISPECIES: DUF3313 family protein [Methylibium]
MTAVRYAIAVACVAAASACSTVMVPPRADFLSSYAALTPDADRGSASSRSVMVIDPARVTIDAIEWRADTGTDITEEERRALLGHLRGALLERVHTLPRAQTGHPAVLRAAITRVETVSPSLNAVSALLLFAPLDRGGAAVEIEALAPDTGQQLAALSLGYFTPLSDMKVRFSRLAPAQLALRKAAADFSELLQPAAGTKPTARD